MTPQPSSADQALLDQFTAALNSHGYGFQYAVARRAQDLAADRFEKSLWKLEMAEMPVEVQGAGTRIDLVFRHDRKPVFLVGECKRANPALANWCFIKAPRHRGELNNKTSVIERVKYYQGAGFRADAETHLGYADHYDIGLEVRTDMKGDPQMPGRGAIEEALTQVLRGMNGFVNALKTRLNLIPHETYCYVLPVIFTTATLWSSPVELNEADLATGKVDTSQHQLTKEKWLWFNYIASPGLKHGVQTGPVADQLRTEMVNSYMRTVAFVSPDGMEDFMGLSSRHPVWSTAS